MRKLIILVAVVLFTALSCSNPEGMTVLNRTGFAIKSLALSYGDLGFPLDNLLDQTLNDGARVVIGPDAFDQPEGTAYKLKAIDEDDDQYFKVDIEFSSGMLVVLTLDDLDI